MTKIRTYDGDGIRVSYDRVRCIHAAECVRGLPAVFDPDRRPWVDPTAAPADEVARVVRRCPTGALQYEHPDGSRPEPAPDTNRLSVTADGPVVAAGDLLLLDAERRPLRRELRVALCRCGASAHKPWCDGSHTGTGFRDAGRLETPRVGEPDEQTDDRLAIRLRRDGPLVLEGRFTLLGSGGEAVEGATAALCRCGRSDNKPFCDGSHREFGFRADDPVAEPAPGRGSG